jgi:uncharacterized protein (TIGR02118 family)
MFKQVCLLTRRPGMSMAEFKDYYETTHAPLLATMMPQARRYLRRFVQPEPSLVTGEPCQVPFDCLMELWWDSRAAFEACMASLGEGDAFARIHADEEKIFASHDNPVFSVEEHESPMRGWTDAPALGGRRQADGADGTLKLVFLLKRMPGMSVEDFRTYYEASHRKLAERALPRVLRYTRRYVQPELNPITREAIELPFDVVMEIWAESRADWDTMQAELAEGTLGAEIWADEERLFASHDNPIFTVEEADSQMRGW